MKDNKCLKPCIYCKEMKDDKSLARHQRSCKGNPSGQTARAKNKECNNSESEYPVFATTETKMKRGRGRPPGATNKIRELIFSIL